MIRRESDGMKIVSFPLFLLAIILIIFSSIILSTTATEINLSIDKDKIFLGDKVKFHLEIYPSKLVGGTFSINKIEGKSRVKLIQVLFSKPSPGSCYTCAGGYPLSENFERDFYFQPKVEGSYYAIANFGDAQERVNFTVFTLTTTTTILPTTTTTTIPENFCNSDEDCACGIHKETKECFYGNKNYVIRGKVNVCPDFCYGISGNLEIKCVNHECKQVSSSTTTLTTTTLPKITLRENKRKENLNNSYTPYSNFYFLLVIFIIILLLLIYLFLQNKHNIKL